MNKKLLIILKDNVVRTPNFTGLCKSASTLCIKNHITVLEKYKLLDYLNENCPPNEMGTCRYWFKKGEREPRLKYLNEHIALLEAQSFSLKKLFNC